MADTVVNGINKKPGQFTAGEGPATGEEVLINVDFTRPILLDPNHYFFRPEVQLADGDFLWLSAPKPIVSPGTPFAADLQSWIRRCLFQMRQPRIASANQTAVAARNTKAEL